MLRMSMRETNRARMKTVTMTRIVDSNNSFLAGHEHFLSSLIVSLINCLSLPSQLFIISILPKFKLFIIYWQVRQGSNLRPAVLETAALPAELLT